MNIVTSLLGALFGSSSTDSSQTIGVLQNQVSTLQAQVKTLKSYNIILASLLAISAILYFRKK